MRRTDLPLFDIQSPRGDFSLECVFFTRTGIRFA
jgi:hypothetical protein